MYAPNVPKLKATILFKTAFKTIVASFKWMDVFVCFNDAIFLLSPQTTIIHGNSGLVIALLTSWYTPILTINAELNRIAFVIPFGSEKT